MSDASSILRERRSSGFTLIEVLVVIAVMTIIATVLTAVVAVILRTTSPTNTRAADSSTLHGLNTYLARDASATAPGDFDFNPGAASNCAGATPGPGTSLVKMTWTEDTGSAITYVANYRYVDQGGGDYTIVRYTCSGAGAGPYGNLIVRELTRPLGSTLPTVIGVGSPTIGVEMTVITQKGEPIKVDGDSRNPAETLPATTTSTTTTTPTTTTTTTTTTTLPPSTCALVEPPGIGIVNNPQNRTSTSGSAARPLAASVTVSIQVTGTCNNVQLRYDRGDGGPQIESFTGTYPNYSLVFEGNDSAQKWKPGPHPLQVFDGAVGPIQTGTYNFNVG